LIPVGAGRAHDAIEAYDRNRFHRFGTKSSQKIQARPEIADGKPISPLDPPETIW
jgi:hypothetical protein